MNNTTKSLMVQITDSSPLLLFIIAGLSFACIMVFKVDYYAHLYSERYPIWVGGIIGFILAFIAEGGRLALMVATVKEVRDGEGWSAFLGLIASAALIGYDIYMSIKIGSLWSTTDPVFTRIIVFLVIMGGVLELRLSLLMRSKSPKKVNTTGNPDKTKVANFFSLLNETEKI